MDRGVDGTNKLAAKLAPGDLVKHLGRDGVTWELRLRLAVRRAKSS